MLLNRFHTFAKLFVLLTLLVAVLAPARFVDASRVGHWDSLCTEKGFERVWVVSDRNAASTVADGDDVGAHAHGGVHCPWCLFSLPALTVLFVLGFVHFRLSHVLRAAAVPLLRGVMVRWLWACPRAPPVFSFSSH